MSKSVVITEAEMRAFLTSGRRPPDRYGRGEDGQLIAVWNVQAQPGLVVKVYTSVIGGTSQPCGADSIRVAVVDETANVGVTRFTWTQRTEGWEDRLRQKIRQAFQLTATIPLCPRCKTRMVLRQNSRDKSYFWGCRSFRTNQCRATHPYFEPTA